MVDADEVDFCRFELLERFERLLVKLVELHVEEHHVAVSLDVKSCQVAFGTEYLHAVAEGGTLLVLDVHEDEVRVTLTLGQRMEHCSYKGLVLH